MSISEQLSALVGGWQGTNQLWMFPNAPVRESDSHLVVSLIAQGKFAQFKYSWADEGLAQDGLLIVGSAEAPRVQAIWIDSWHMQDKMMNCAGSAQGEAGFSVLGAYEAPPGPDWGWRIEVTPQGAETLLFRMYNCTPDGQEMLAVETIFKRRS